MSHDPYTTAARYGVPFSGELVSTDYHDRVSNETISLAEVKRRGGKITRLRLLKERGRVDVSYIHATLADGSIVRVSHPLGNLIPLGRLPRDLVAWAKEEGVYGVSVGLLDESNWSILG